MLDESRKRDLVNRLRSVEGHIRGIERMVEQDAYCMDILKQVKAVQQALERVSAMTLENHLNTCVATAIRSDSEPEKLARGRLRSWTSSRQPVNYNQCLSNSKEESDARKTILCAEHAGR